MDATDLDGATAELAALAAKLPKGGLGAYARVHAGLVMLVALETINTRQEDDPLPVLRKALGEAKGVVSSALSIAPELDASRSSAEKVEIGVGHTIDLFENAWTTYSRETYDHSVRLVEERLRRSGFDGGYFKGKTCFDGGCGTGRLSVAMAKMGAEKVTAVDLGTESLDYMRDVVKRLGLKDIEIVARDVTDLSAWDDGTYDFVASNGVLHHTKACDRGIVEHFRITKPGGIFWAYLYGAGGLYWRQYDALKPMVVDIRPADIRRILSAFGVREGLIYTYLDNFLAPRVYYLLTDFLDLLKRHGDFTWRHAKGRSEIDDTELLLKTAYGPVIYGPQGEVRVVIQKNA
jgi:ubiquinone/menaquinone biosynthesis C-methylase UbiE